MSYEMVGRQQRTKTALLNKGLLPSLIFCFCVWLLYLVWHSNCSRNDYVGSIETHLCGQSNVYVYVYIERKMLREWLIDKVLCDSEDESTKEGGTGFGNDESNENQKNKSQVANFHDETGYVLEEYRSDEAKDVENEPGIMYFKELPNCRGKNLDSENSEQVHLDIETEEQDQTEEDSEEGYHDMSKLKGSEPWDWDNQQIIKKSNLGTSKMENGEASHEKRNNDEESIIQESSTTMDLNETGHQFQAFDDENGIRDISGWTTTLVENEVEEETTTCRTSED